MSEYRGSLCKKRNESRKHFRLFPIVYLFTGAAALVWFLIRVVPKPSRAAYPCQRAAFPIATSFVLWLAGVAGSAAILKNARSYLKQAKYALAALCAGCAVALFLWAFTLPSEDATAAWSPSDPPNSPIGAGKGVHPGRVVWVYEPKATSWDGRSRYWWSNNFTDQALVEAMLSVGLRRLTGAPDDEGAWDALFRYFNRTHGRGDRGYEEGERIAIKINMNVAGDYSLTNEPIVSPQVVLALLRQLVDRAGVKQEAITVYDASRCVTSAVYGPCRREYPGVRFCDRQGGGGNLRATAATETAIHFADRSVRYSGQSRIPQCVFDAAYLINLALLRGHSLAGVTLCAKNHFGSVWRPNGGWSPSHMHDSISRDRPMKSPNALVDLMGHEHLGGKTLLFMIDALYAAINQSSSTPSRWRMEPFNNDWTSSLFLSQDGVAIDSVALDFCRSETTLSGQVRGISVDNYLHEAALAGNPPSGVVYDPEGDGTPLESLGVHEHWNNALDKQYSRNLGTGEGIELVSVRGIGGFVRGDVNADGRIDVSDAVGTLYHLFVGRQLPCLKSADTNDSGDLDLADAIYLLTYLFAGGEPPPPPFPHCGPDTTGDPLTCTSFAPCGSP